MKVENSSGEIFYGMHFYPGVAQYQESDTSYRIFLNEETLRKMDPSFAGKPVFVDHVMDVNQNIDELRSEADGWVIESFYNQADGKHWVKFIITSERGKRAVKNGLRLSNAYVPKGFSNGGMWNGVEYAKEVTSGEFEHLALVSNPRYNESEVLTPEKFKKYNEDKILELKKLSNSQSPTKGEVKMKFNFFKRAKVENAIDPELIVVLPKSGKEKTVAQLINEADDMVEKEKDMNSGLADMSHKVKMHDGSYCNVGELLEKHKAMQDELEAMKAKKEDSVEHEGELEVKEAPVEVEGDKKNDESEDKDAKKKALELAEHEEKEIAEAKKQNQLEEEKKKAEAKKKADALRNAHLKANAVEETMHIDLPQDRVARGKVHFGS